MGTYYDTEVERQKKGDFTANTVLPILAALETIATAKATRGQNIGTSTLGLMKDTQASREGALDRAMKADDSAWSKSAREAEATRQGELFGFQKKAAERSQTDWDREAKQRTDVEAKKKAAIDRFLGVSAEIDPVSGATIKPASPGLEGLSELDKEAIKQDPFQWLTNKLKPAPTQLMVGADGSVVPVLKTTGKTPEGKTVIPPKPEATQLMVGDEGFIVPVVKKTGLTPEGKTVSPNSNQKKAKLPASTVLELSGAQEAIKQLDQMMAGAKDLKTDYGPFNALRTINPYDQEAQDFNQLVATTKQVIGKGLEGGVLRKEDEAKYEKILPSFKDTKEVRIQKAKQLEQMIINKHNTQLQTLSDANYDTGDIPQAVSTAAPSVPEGTERVNKQGVNMRMTGGKWQPAQ